MLGSDTYGNVVVANGNLYVGTNNGNAYLKRYPNSEDLGVLLCFRELDGKFLWQYSREKLPGGRVHDWPQQGICSAPVVEGHRLWFVSNRGEVICLDAEGFRDGENDGSFASEKLESKMDEDELHESDIVWKFDMMKELGVQQHNMEASYSIPAKVFLGSHLKWLIAIWSGSNCLVAFFEVDRSLLRFQSRPRPRNNIVL